MRHIMYVGGCWGNAIYFLNPEKEEKDRIYGFKFKTPSNGSVLFDLAHNKGNDTIPLYYVDGIKCEDDPKDMFFADIKLIGNIRNPRPTNEDYGLDWYIEPCKELLEEFLSRSWWWRFKHREYIKVLKGMIES